MYIDVIASNYYDDIVIILPHLCLTLDLDYPQTLKGRLICKFEPECLLVFQFILVV